MNEDLSVRFGAETAGLEAGVDRSKQKIGEVTNPVVQLQAMFEEMKTAVNAAFSPAGDGLKGSATDAVNALEFMRGVIEGMEAELKETFSGPANNGVVGASKEAQAALEQVNAAIAQGKSITAEAIAQMGGLANVEQLVAKEAMEQADAVRVNANALDQLMAKIRGETAAWKENKEEREVLLRTMQQQQALESKGIQLTDQQIDKLHELNRAYIQNRNAAQEAERGERGVNTQRGIGGGLLTSLKGNLLGMVASVAAAFSINAVMNWARAIGDASQKVNELSQRLGMSVTDVQMLSAIAQVSGTNIDQLATGVSRLDVSFAMARAGAKQQGQAFRELDIDVNGTYTNMELLREVMDRFKDMPDGPQKTALAIRTMGQAGATLIPFLNQGAQGFDELNTKIEKYGLLSAEAQAAGMRLGNSMDENKLAMQGLQNVLAQAFAPVLADITDGINKLVAGFIKSYQEGGAAKQFLEGLATTIRWVTVVIVALWTMGDQAFTRLWGLIVGMVGEARAQFAQWRGDCALLGNAFTLLGLAMLQGLIGPWPQIQQAINDNLAEINRKVAATKAEVASIRLGTSQQTGSIFGGADSRYQQTEDWANGFLNPAAGAPAGAPPKPPGSTGGMGGPRGSAGAGGDNRVQKWREELHSMQIASGEFFLDQTRMELEFWEKKLALTKAGSKAWLQVQEMIFNAKKKLAQEAYDEEIAMLDEQIQVAQENNAEQVRLMEEKVAKVKATYGAESTQYRAALREQRALQREHQEELLRLTMDGINDRRDAARSSAEADRAEAQSRASIEMTGLEEKESQGKISATRMAVEKALARQREFAAEMAHQERMFQLWVQAERDREALARAAGRLEEADRINRGIEQAQREHNGRMRVLAAEGAAQAAQDQAQVSAAVLNHWQGVFQPIGDGFGQMVNSMVTGAKSFADIWNDIGLQMLNNITNWLAQMVTQWLASEMAKTGITLTGVSTRTGIEAAGHTTSMAMTSTNALATVAANAIKAASGAYSAIAGIPVIGPFLAPVVAAGALAAVLAMGKSIFSAEGGWGEVPVDGARTTLHKGEMVLPQSLAQPLRAQLQGGGNGAIGNAAAKAFSPNLTFNTIDGPSMRRWWDRNGDAMVQEMERKYRAFAMQGAN